MLSDQGPTAARAPPLFSVDSSHSSSTPPDEGLSSPAVTELSGPPYVPSANGEKSATIAPAVIREPSASLYEECGNADAISTTPIAPLRPCECKEDGRNLVVCIDGTSNQFSKKNTNVVELYSRLKKDSDAQITFYNSGIGTYATPSWKSWSYYKQVLWHKIDLAIAWEFERILLSAYVWLSENYRDGDRIFLFGFSRGAYQVRALSAMIEMVGLIHRGNEDQIPFAYELYATAQTTDVAEVVVARTVDLEVGTAGMDSGDCESISANSVSSAESYESPLSMNARFKTTFSRAVRVHFVGSWDTVSSVGIVRGKNLPGTADGMGHVCYFRHALALHERRVKFLPEYVRGGLGPDVRALGDQAAPHTKEVWFAGSHSDIGGGSSKNESLNRFGPSLRWMSFEATQFGLMLDKIPLEWKDKSKTSQSLVGSWRLLEYLPFTRLSYTGQDDTSWWPHLGQSRVIRRGQRVHESAVGCVDAGRAVVSDDVSWDELVNDEHVERDVYAAAGHIFSALSRRSKRNQPLRQKELRALSVLLETERGKASLRGIETNYSSKRSESIVVPLLSDMVQVVKVTGAEPYDSTLPVEAARTVLKVLETLKARCRPEQLRSAALALSKVDIRLADELMTRFSDSALQAPLRGHAKAVCFVAFLPDGRRLVSSSADSTLRIWDIETGVTVVGPLGGHTNSVRCLAVHGSYIASGSYDGTFRVWNADSGKPVAGPITAHNGKKVSWIAYSKDGTHMVTAGYDNNVVLWDANTAVQVREMTGHTAPAMCVAFLEDGKRVVSGSSDKTIRIWDVASGECIGEPLTGHRGMVHALCLSPDDTRLFSLSSDDRTIRIWDTETRALIVEPLRMDDWVLCMALSPDGKRLVSGSRSGRIAMWDAETGAAVTTAFRDHRDVIWGLAFSLDGRKIASASRDETIGLWGATDDWNRWDMDDEDMKRDDD